MKTGVLYQFAERLADCGLSEAAWWKVPIDARRNFYQGQTCFIILDLPDGSRLANFITPALPPTVFDK